MKLALKLGVCGRILLGPSAPERRTTESLCDEMPWESNLGESNLFPVLPGPSRLPRYPVHQISLARNFFAASWAAGFDSTSFR